MLETVGKAGKATDALLDAYLTEKALAGRYEQQLDRAADAVCDALEERPNDMHLLRISRALTD